MTDLFDETFAALDEYYPNSKRKRRELVEEKPVKLALSWDSRPFFKTLPNGEEIEMFTLKALGDALHRPVATLRMWMQLGHLPSAPYRLPSSKDKNGNDKAGRRLYSRAMIEAAIKIFQTAGVLTSTRVEWTLHQQITIDLAEAWNKIRASEMKQTD